jgi:hypothetical protein
MTLFGNIGIKRAKGLVSESIALQRQCAAVVSNNVVWFAVSKYFYLSSVSTTGGRSTWIAPLDVVLEARTKQDPKDVPQDIWNAFLIFSLALVPCIEGW